MNLCNYISGSAAKFKLTRNYKLNNNNIPNFVKLTAFLLFDALCTLSGYPLGLRLQD